MAAIVHADGRVEIVRDVVQPGDPRLADARDPNPHASTHADGGSDPIVSELDPLAYPVSSGPLASRGSASTGPRLYFADDAGIVYRSDGSSWTAIAVTSYFDLSGIPSTFAPSAHGGDHVDGGADEIAAPLDPRAYPTEAGPLANIPGASVANAGRLYFSEDEEVLYRNGGGGTWAAMLYGFQLATQSSDAAEYSATLADTDLVFNVDANSVYLVDLFILFRSAGVGQGLRLAWDTSVAVTSAAVAYAHVLANTGTLTGGDAVADNTSRGVSSGVNTAAVDIPLIAQGMIVTGANAGTARLRFASETAGLPGSGVTFRANSVLRAMKVL